MAASTDASSGGSDTMKLIAAVGIGAAMGAVATALVMRVSKSNGSTSSGAKYERPLI